MVAAVSFLLSLAVLAVPASAQTSNPRVVSFLASADHDAVGADGQPLVSWYEFEVFNQGGTTPITVASIGKPAPATDGTISVDFMAVLGSPPATGVVLEARVAAVGPAGRGESDPSNTFIFDAAPACSATVAPLSVSAPAGGATATFNVTVAAGCTWQAASATSWITVTAGASGSGSGTVALSVAPNTATSSRSSTVSVAGQAVTVTEAAAAPPPNVGPVVQLTSPSSGSSYTAPATIGIAANAADTDGTVTTVSFYANGALVASDVTTPFTATWTNVAAGSYAITAVATDNAGAKTTSAAVNVSVAAATSPVPSPNVAPTVQITSPAGGSTVPVSSTVSVTASASDRDGTIARVDFYANGALIGTDMTSPYQAAWTPLKNGGFTLTAVATDNAGAKTTSAGVTVNVKRTRGRK